jgi:carboxyl-terminal processing protease
VVRSVDRLVSDGARGVVLDLRGNPGGLLEEATSILELFLDAGMPMGSVEGRDAKGAKRMVAGATQRWPGLQVVVLVDPETASAAEIIAAALQENHRAVVVGQPTFGKGHVQGTLRLSDELSVRISVARWVSPSGHRLDRARGDVVVPDVVVSPWRPGPGDDSLRAAVAPRSDDFRQVLEEAVRRGEWMPADDSTASLPARFKALARRARLAGFTVTSQQLAAGVGLLDQEWAVLAAAGADLSSSPRRARVPDAQLLAAWRMLEGGER